MRWKPDKNAAESLSFLVEKLEPKPLALFLCFHYLQCLWGFGFYLHGDGVSFFNRTKGPAIFFFVIRGRGIKGVERGQDTIVVVRGHDTILTD